MNWLEAILAIGAVYLGIGVVAFVVVVVLMVWIFRKVLSEW